MYVYIMDGLKRNKIDYCKEKCTLKKKNMYIFLTPFFQQFAYTFLDEAHKNGARQGFSESTVHKE